jgi:hypothetical protein
MIDIFTFNHLLWVIAGFLIIVGVHYLFRSKDKKFQFWFIFGLIVASWLVHFSRLIKYFLLTYVDFQLFYIHSYIFQNLN